MKSTAIIFRNKLNIKILIFDSIVLATIYFIPALSHTMALPVYLIEPMRLMLIIAIAHTSRMNAYLLAATIPLFSFLVSAHPHFIKMLLITVELLLNVWLFYFMLKKSDNIFFSILSSILVSKIAYYLLKFGLISALFIEGNLVATPLLLQAIMTLIFSGYIFLIFRKKSNFQQ